jgi:hypothetical protein
MVTVSSQSVKGTRDYLSWCVFERNHPPEAEAEHVLVADLLYEADAFCLAERIRGWAAPARYIGASLGLEEAVAIAERWELWGLGQKRSDEALKVYYVSASPLYFSVFLSRPLREGEERRYGAYTVTVDRFDGHVWDSAEWDFYNWKKAKYAACRLPLAEEELSAFFGGFPPVVACRFRHIAEPGLSSVLRHPETGEKFYNGPPFSADAVFRSSRKLGGYAADSDPYGGFTKDQDPRGDGLEQRFGFFSRRRVFENPLMAVAASALAEFEAGECSDASVEKLSAPLFELDAFEVRANRADMNVSELAFRLSIVGAPVVGRSSEFLYGMNDQNVPFRYSLAAREIDRFFLEPESIDRYSLSETPQWVV